MVYTAEVINVWLSELQVVRNIEQLNAALWFTVLQQCAKARSAGKWVHAYRQFSAAETHYCSFYNAENATLKQRCILDI